MPAATEVRLAAASDAELDRPQEVFRRNPRVGLASGVVLQRLADMRAVQMGGPPGFQVFAAYLRLSVDPARSTRSGDVRFTITIGDTIFHDGRVWQSHTGPFAANTSSIPRERCFAKFVYLPAHDPRFVPGAELPLRVTFPRTRQRMVRQVVVTAGHDNAAHATNAEIAEVKRLGCTPFPVTSRVTAYGVKLPYFQTPVSVSPGSSALRGREGPSPGA